MNFSRRRAKAACLGLLFFSPEPVRVAHDQTQFFPVDGLQLSITVEVPLQKGVIHAQAWRFATFCRSRRRRC